MERKLMRAIVGGLGIIALMLMASVAIGAESCCLQAGVYGPPMCQCPPPSVGETVREWIVLLIVVGLCLFPYYYSRSR